jgi:hypothetical protein
LNSVTAARADQLAEALEAAALLGDRDGEQGLALLAELGPLGDEAQAVEVHVGAAGDGHQVRPFSLCCSAYCLMAATPSAPAGSRMLRVSWNTSLIAAHTGVGVDDHEVVDQFAGDAEGLLAHQLDGRAVGEQAHVGQRHALAGAHRAQHRVGIVRLHADDLDLRAHRLDVGWPRPRSGRRRRWPRRRRRSDPGAGAGSPSRSCPGRRSRRGRRTDARRSGPARCCSSVAAVGIGVAVAVQHHVAAERARRRSSAWAWSPASR